MKSKTIFVLLMIVSASLMIGSVSAGFLDDVFEEFPTNVTYDGIVFNIPENFEERNDLNVSDLTFEDEWGAANVDYHVFVDLDDNVYCISIADFSQGIDLNQLGGGNLTKINGHQGYLEKQDEDYYFSYPADNDTAVILIAEDKSLFEKIIV